MWEFFFFKERSVFRFSACLSPSQARWRCQAGCSASHGCLNWGSEMQAGQGWAGRVKGERRGDPAGVWLRSNPGDYYRWDTHTYTHTSTGICCWRQSWLPWFPPVRGDNVSGHSAWRAEISQWTQDKRPFITLWALFQSLNSCGCVFICVSAFVCTWRGLGNRKRQEGRVDARGLGMNAGVWAQQREDLLPLV